MSKAITTLITDKGTITHQGTSGITLTATRQGDDVETLIEYSEISIDVLREMVGVLLCMLDDLEGEHFIASCFARYAEETHKRFFVQENGRTLVIIRGGRP